MAKVKKASKKSPVKSKVKAKVVKAAPKAVKKVSKPKVEKTVVKIPKLGVPKAPYKKSEFLGTLAEQASVAKKDVVRVLEALQAITTVHLAKSGPGQFTLPGMFKMTVRTRPATKAKKGRNPFTGEEMMIKAKPARRVVKVRVLKKFKNELE